MVRFKARQHFLVPHGKIDFFAEAGRKRVYSFLSKEKMFLSDQGTDYLEIHWFPYISQILSPKIAPKVGPFSLHAFSTIHKFGQFWNLESLKLHTLFLPAAAKKSIFPLVT